MSKFVLGVDLGGTNIRLGVVNYAGKIVSRSNLTTKSFRHNKNKLIKALVQALKSLIKENDLKKRNIAGIGIGLPGLINTKRGMVHVLPNIPGWKNVPLAKILEKKLGIKTLIDNDVNLIGLAEWKFGAGKGSENMLCVTLGTGVGGALILNKELYRGEGFAAGEIGHMPLNEKGPVGECGHTACFETYVGHRQLSKKAGRVLGRKKVSLPEMRKLARQGNRKARRFWEEAGTRLGNGLIGVINLLNPKLIVIGGGVAYSHMFLFKTVRKVIKERCMAVQGKMVKIKRAKLGEDAGIIGAQVLINNASKSR